MPVPVKTKNEWDILLGQQTTWGTALVDGTNFDGTSTSFGEIMDVEPTPLEFGVNVRRPNRSNSGRRSLITPNLQHDYKGAMPSINLRGDAKKKTLPALLYAVMQNVTEGAVTPYSKTYQFPATQPDFTVNAGWFGTLIAKQPNASASQKLTDVICRKLTLSCEPENNQGRLQFAAELVGRGAPILTSNPSGTLARFAQDFFYFHDIKVFTGNGQALLPMSINVEITNGAVPVSVDSADLGKFKTWGLTEYAVTATIRVLYDSAAQALQALVGTTVDHLWAIEWGTAGADGYLSLTINGQPGPAPDVNEALKTIDFTITGMYNEIGPKHPLTAVIADALDRNW